MAVFEQCVCGSEPKMQAYPYAPNLNQVICPNCGLATGASTEFSEVMKYAWADTVATHRKLEEIRINRTLDMGDVVQVKDNDNIAKNIRGLRGDVIGIRCTDGSMHPQKMLYKISFHDGVVDDMEIPVEDLYRLGTLKDFESMEIK